MSAIPRKHTNQLTSTVLDQRLELTRVNPYFLAFLGVVLLSIITHLWSLGTMALHHDESIHAWSSWRFYTGAGTFTCADGRQAETYCYDPVFHGPSLYSFTALAYFLFGDGDAQARLPMAIAGILMVASSWMLRPYFGNKGTLIAAILLAFSPSLLYYTRFARHDGLMVLWEIWMVLGLFRWLDTGKARYLYLLMAGASLAVATHELYYILFFLFGMCVIFRLSSELLPQRKLQIGMLVIFAIAVIITIINPQITSSLKAGGLAMLLAVVTGLGLLMQRVWDPRPLLWARCQILWQHRRHELWIALGVYLGIYVLLYSTYFADPRGIVDGAYQGLKYWLGSQHEYARGDQPWYYYIMLMPLYEPIALLLSLGTTIWVFTRRQFAASSPEAIIAEQSSEPSADVVSDEQTTAIVVEDPESGLEQDSVADLTTNEVQAESNHSAPETTTTPIENLDQANIISHAVVNNMLPLFLAFWFIGAFVAFSWAGEKMPWLVVHIALPGNLLAAWVLGRMLDFVSEKLGSNGPEELQAQRKQILWIPVVTIFTIVFLAVALWRQLGASSNLAGQSAILQSLIPLLAAGGMIYTLLTLGNIARLRLTLVLSSLALVALLAAYEIRATWMVVYDHPDVPIDPLVYVQSSPDIPLISQEIHELAISQTRNQRTDKDPIGGLSMPVIMDTGDEGGEYSLSWPFYWYFRDLQRIEGRKADFFENATAESFMVNAASGSGQELAPVVMVAVPHMTDATRQALEANYTKRWSSHLNWWFPYGNKCSPSTSGYTRFYYNTWSSAERIAKDAPTGCGPSNLSPEEFKASKEFYPIWRMFTWPFEPANFAGTWRYILYRDLPGDLKLSGREFEVWMRKDLVGGSSSSSSTTTTSSPTVKLVPEQVIDGSQLFVQASGITTDQNGNIYVADAAQHTIFVFDPQGNLLREVGDGRGSGPGQLNEPHGVAVDSNGNLYVANTWNGRIEKFDANGQFVANWGTGVQDEAGRTLHITDGTVEGNEAAPLGFYGPRGVVVDADGNVYISDTGNKRIVVTDSQGTYKYQWGSFGSGLGQFNEPIGLALDNSGNLYVGDTWNSRVQVFGRDGNGNYSPIPSVSWPISGWAPNTYFNPFVAASGDGKVYATVPSNNLALYANMRGDVMLRWGGAGNNEASMSSPTGITVDKDGLVYVLDSGTKRILKFSLPNLAPAE